jgi:hypothetical protein
MDVLNDGLSIGELETDMGELSSFPEGLSLRLPSRIYNCLPLFFGGCPFQLMRLTNGARSQSSRRGSSSLCPAESSCPYRLTATGSTATSLYPITCTFVPNPFPGNALIAPCSTRTASRNARPNVLASWWRSTEGTGGKVRKETSVGVTARGSRRLTRMLNVDRYVFHALPWCPARPDSFLSCVL